MKIICVGWNYTTHNKEMDLTLIQNDPTLFMKPETALLKDGKPFFLPDFSDRIEYETEIVVRISRLGKNISEKFANRYYDAVTVGIDFTARDLQTKLRKDGSPWEISKAFDNAAPIGDFILLKDDPERISKLHFSMKLNDNTVQEGFTGDMLHSVDQIIAYASKFFTLKVGDLIFTGTPAGVGPVKIGDNIKGFIENEKVLDFDIK